MATDEILRLCKALSLSEEDGPVLDITGDVQADGIRSVKHCLVGKILSRRKVNREAFRGTIEQIWGTVGRVEIEMVGDNVFVFHFQSLEDKAMVWSRGPWHFDKNLIVLEKPVGPGAISQLQFKFSEFWIHIYNIPLACMNCKVARLIAEEVGTIVDFPIDSKDLWGKFLRIKVSIDITKPLKRGIRMRLENFDSMITALIKYERLPDFCYGCGFIGHSFRECHNSEVRKSIMEGAEHHLRIVQRKSSREGEGSLSDLSSVLLVEDDSSFQVIQSAIPSSREVLAVVPSEDGHSEAHEYPLLECSRIGESSSVLSSSKGYPETIP
ncbi:hypothetical protein ACOSQ4_003453 [Xanthoceras sorbifolium]